MQVKRLNSLPPAPEGKFLAGFPIGDGGPNAAIQRPGIDEEHVMPGTAGQEVRPAAAIEHVIAGIAVHRIVAATAVDEVVAIRPTEDVALAGAEALPLQVAHRAGSGSGEADTRRVATGR